VVTCEPLRVCDVELGAGEEIQNVSLGDSSRWLVHPAFSGARESLTPHVMVKPTEYDIATNAIITTNRRTYCLGLVSKAKGDPGHVRRVKFYYPRDLVEQVPGTLQASEAPALLVQGRGGESALVNYRVRLPYYVVDRLFHTAVLIVGVGRQQDRVTIRRKADGQ
jgi:type IV secretion system protein TrbG